MHLTAFLTTSLLTSATAILNPRVVSPSNFTLLQRGHYNGSLYKIELGSGGAYESGDVLLVDLHGSRYEQGYDFGMLAGIGAESNYNSLLNALLKTGGIPGFSERFALEALIDQQWEKWLSRQVPEEYMQEIAGFNDGATVAKTKIAGGKLMSRAITLANLPGDVKDILFVLADEQTQGKENLEDLARQMQLPQNMSVHDFVATLDWPKAQCSMMAVWGSRTVNGELLSGRNLDWNQNTGINEYKLVAVWHPPEPGRHAHATFGFAATGQGALTGMSAKGLTMHEANLESNMDTFRGFPWLLRLRYVMENSDDLASATALFESTNNTVGFNHMVGSAVDKSAIVFETMQDHSGVFYPNDPREKVVIVDAKVFKLQVADLYTNSKCNLLIYSDAKNTSFVVRGSPMPEALFRTNHGFDPFTVKHYMWNGTHAYRDSDLRYRLIAEQVVGIAGSEGTPMGALHMVNLTSLAGQKGKDYFECKKPYGGTNVVSVAYQPAELTVYAAWEDGANDTWVPAACSTYVKLDMRRWF